MYYLSMDSKAKNNYTIVIVLAYIQADDMKISYVASVLLCNCEFMALHKNILFEILIQYLLDLFHHPCLLVTAVYNKRIDIGY